MNLLYLKRKEIMLILSFIAPISSSYANEIVPNAGSISREIDVNQPSFKIEQQKNIVENDTIAKEANPSDAIKIEIKTLRLIGMKIFDQNELLPLVKSLEGKTSTLGEIRTVVDKITQYYHSAGYVLSRAIIPPQKLIDGVFTIQIIEGKVSQVKSVNQSRLKDEVLERYLKQAYSLNEPLYAPQSGRALLLIRDLAGIADVNYSLQAGKEKDETLLVANVFPTQVVNGNISVDNHGGKSTGKYRSRLDLYINNLFGRGEQVNLQGMSSFRGLNNGKLGVTLPVGYNGLIFNGNISHTEYKLGKQFKKLDASGKSTTISIGGRYPIIRSNNRNLWISTNVEKRYLFDEVSSTNTLTKKRLSLINVGINADIRDQFLNGGYNQFSLVNTFGNLNIRSKDAREIDALSAKTQGQYYKLNLSVSRTQFLNSKWNLFTKITAQWANKNLDSSEQLSLGGLDAVLGYSSNAASGDSGIITNLQLRYAFNPYITLTGFYDIGYLKIRNKPYVNEKNYRNLQDIGIGLDIKANGLIIEAKSAWKINKPDDINEHDPKIWLKATYQF